MLCDVRLLLPPLTDQRRIVSILDAADELPRLRQQADHRTDDLIPGLFHKMFGDPATNPKGWPTTRLGDHAEFVTSGSRGWARHYAESGAKFIRVQNLTGHLLFLDDLAFVATPDNAETRRTRTKAGDLLILITGVVGLVAVVPPDLGEAFVSQHVA